MTPPTPSKDELLLLLGELLTTVWPLADDLGLAGLLKPHLPPDRWTREAVAEALARLLAELVTEGWDRHGAPGVARHPVQEGRWVGSFEGPGKPYTVEASSKREAYRLARREWVKRLLLSAPEG